MSLSKKALIIGVGGGLSLSLARLFHKQGMSISLVARNVNKLENVKKELEANVFKCDVSSPIDVEDLFSKLDDINEEPNLVIYNPSSRVRGPIEELDIENTRHALNITSFGAFLVAQQSVKRMKKKGSGSIFFYRSICKHKGLSEFVSIRNG